MWGEDAAVHFAPWLPATAKWRRIFTPPSGRSSKRATMAWRRTTLSNTTVTSSVRSRRVMPTGQPQVAASARAAWTAWAAGEAWRSARCSTSHRWVAAGGIATFSVRFFLPALHPQLSL
jgi:hypothetical protein